MNKKIFGIKLGTILSAVICLFLALVIWMLVKYQLEGDDMATAFIALRNFTSLRG